MTPLIRLPRLALSALAALLALGAPIARAAPADLDIVDNTLIQEYPAALRFRLKAGRAEGVASVFLVYGSDRRNCADTIARQKVDFTASAGSLSAEWAWELKRTEPMPPGAQVWWEWEINFDGGARVTTPRQTAIVADPRLKWQTARRGAIVANWSAGDAAFGQFILSEAAAAQTRIASVYGVTVTQPIRIWVYPSADYLEDILWSAPDWAGGVALAPNNTSLMGISPDSREWAQTVIPHELTHLIIDQRILNCAGAQMPVWLSEGLAVTSEPVIRADREAMIKAVSSGELDGLPALATGFSNNPRLASLAYTYSGEVVRYLAKTFGPSRLDALLGAIQDGRDNDAALLEVYGFDTAGLDRAWRASVGIKTGTPAATATPRPSGVAPRPTAPPTLALYTAVPVAPRPSATASPVAATTAAPTLVAANAPEQPTSAPTPAALPAPGADTSLPVLLGGTIALVAGLVISLALRRRARR